MNKLLIVLFFAIYPVVVSAQKQSTVVHLLFKYTNQEGVRQLTLKQNNKVLTKVFSDFDGFAKIDRISRQTADCDLFLTSGEYEIFLTSIKPQSPDTITINLPARYKKRLGKTVCPKCGKTNRVTRSVFADPQPVKKEKNRGIIYPFGKRSNTNSAKTSATPLTPQWFCTRDSILF